MLPGDLKKAVGIFQTLFYITANICLNLMICWTIFQLTFQRNIQFQSYFLSSISYTPVHKSGFAWEKRLISHIHQWNIVKILTSFGKIEILYAKLKPLIQNISFLNASTTKRLEVSKNYNYFEFFSYNGCIMTYMHAKFSKNDTSDSKHDWNYFFRYLIEETIFLSYLAIYFWRWFV